MRNNLCKLLQFKGCHKIYLAWNYWGHISHKLYKSLDAFKVLRPHHGTTIRQIPGHIDNNYSISAYNCISFKILLLFFFFFFFIP